MANDTKFELLVSDDDEGVAYLRLPAHRGTGPGIVARTINLRSLLGDYEGPDVNVDFDAANVLIGIEILD